MGRYVYLLHHETDNNSWTAVYGSKRAALRDLNKMRDEYKSDGIELDDTDGKGEHFNCNEIYLYIEKVGVRT